MRVVERDREAEREDRVLQDVVADERHPDVVHARDDAHHDRRERRCLVPRVHVAKRLRQRLVGGHRERAAGGRQDRRLGRRDRRDHDRDHEQPAVRPEQAVLDGEEEVVGVRLVAEARARLAEPRVHHGGDRDADVGDEQDDGGQQGRAPGDALGVLGLLVEGEAGVPAPVDEEGEQHGLGEPAPVGEAERVEPLPRGTPSHPGAVPLK